MKEQLRKLLAFPAVSGWEDPLTDYLAAELAPYCDEWHKDNLGSVIFHQKGDGEPILVNVPISENGFFVTSIEESGKARIAQVGNGTPSEFVNRMVRRADHGLTGVVYSEKKEGTPEAGDLVLDIGCSSKEEAEEILQLAQVFAPTGESFVQSGTFYGSGLWSRVAIAVVMEVMKHSWGKNKRQIIYAFTVMDNLGFKGARVAARSIQPEEAYIIGAADPAAEGKPVELGKGPALRIKDSYAISNRPFRERVIKTLSANQVPYQLEILTKEGLTNNEMMYLGQGILTANLNVPIRSRGTAFEALKLSDGEETIRALTLILLNK